MLFYSRVKYLRSDTNRFIFSKPSIIRSVHITIEIINIFQIVDLEIYSKFTCAFFCEK